MQGNKKITGSLIQAYLVCHRQAWLMSRNLIGNQSNEFVEIGRFISENSYKRSKKEIKIKGGIVDIVYKENNKITLIEIKKSSKMIEASKMQLLFYIYNMREKVSNIKAEIRVPKENKIVEVELNNESQNKLEKTLKEIKKLLKTDKPLKPEKIKYCNNCSYNEFCWS